MDEALRQKLHEALRFAASRSVISAVEEKEIIATFAVTEGELSYQEYRRTLTEHSDEPADLPRVLRMLERWGPDALPANEKGQIPFARALLESAEDAIRKHLEAATAARPSPAAPPEGQPAAAGEPGREAK